MRKKLIVLLLLFLLFTGLGVAYTNWNSGEPNDSNGEDCTEMYDGGNWNDIGCGDAHTGVCEYPDGSYDTTSTTSFSDAQQTCQNRGGHLAVINDADENQYIDSNYGNVWIGYYQPDNEGEPEEGWQWVDTNYNYNGDQVQVETGYFKANVDGTKVVNDLGFTPNYVEFTVNQKIESINTETSVAENSGCPQNVNGWSEGTAVFDSGSLQDQMSIGMFRNSDSTNEHRVASSQSDIIRNVYTDQSGNECGKLEISMSQQVANGFETEIESRYNFNEIVTYRAYRFPDSMDYDAGLAQIQSTGQKDVDTGFNPRYLNIRTGQTIDSFNSNENRGGNYFGLSDGYATLDSGSIQEQLSLGYGTNSHSTNNHRAYSSSNYIINNLYVGQGGTVDGRTRASVEAGSSNGFSLNVDNSYQNEVFMYRAFGDGAYNVDIGSKEADSTGNLNFNQIGFEPSHFGIHTSQRVSQLGASYDSGANNGCSNTYGSSHGWMEPSDDHQYSLSTGRNSDSMNSHRISSSSSSILNNVYSSQNQGECGHLEGSVTGVIEDSGVTMDVSQHYVDELLVYNAFDFSIVTSDPNFDGDRYVSDGTKQGDNADISTGSPDFGIDVSHPANADVTVDFISPSSGSAFATDYIEGGDGQATGTWSGLQSGETYRWKVRACDSYGNCQETSTWSFTVNYGDQIGLRDEDFHPQGADVSQDNPFFTGYIDRVMDNSSQLEPGMESTYFGMSDSYSNPDQFHMDFSFIDSAQEAKWFDSQGTTDRADRWSISDDVRESIGNTGESYEPGGTYYHPGYDGTKRVNPNDPTIGKPAKVFANSYAAVATEQLANANADIREGYGVWIDPDNIKKYDHFYRNTWEEKVRFDIDLTGPDAGLGFDSDSFQGNNLGSFEYASSNDLSDYEVVGDIYWENEYQGKDKVPGPLQESMCGDDQTEYLVEEIGEINNSERFIGNYACATTNDVCYDSQADGSRLFTIGSYHDTDDFTEYEGRTKDDAEICRQYDWTTGRFSGDDIQEDYFPGWYDQDFREPYCDENTLYNDAGVRWVDDSYVENNPHSVTGGIDDDWNAYVSDKIGSVASAQPYTSYPNQESWSGMESPVPTGTNGDQIATLGFCGGDDDGEYMVTQSCVSSACESNNDVIGVANDPDVCVADGEVITNNQQDVQSVEYEDEDGNWQNMEGIDSRRLVQEGRSIELNYAGDTRQLTCFAGAFLGDWPVIFQEDSVSVPYGETTTTTFRLVNPDQQEVTYNVELETDDDVSSAGLESFTSFVDQESETEFTAEVPARSAETYQIEIRGGNRDIDNGEVTVYAESTDEQITGSDSAAVEVVEPSETGAGRQGASPDAIPGITVVQALVLSIMAAASVFLFA